MQECNTTIGLSADTGSTRSLTDSSVSSKSIEVLPENRPTPVPLLWDNIEACPRIIRHVPQSVGEEISLWDPKDLAEFVRAAKIIASTTSDVGSSEAYTSFLRGSEATSRLEPTTSVLDPASSPKGTGLPLRSPPPLWSSSVIASCMEAKYPNGIAGRPPTQTLSVNTTEVFASTSSIPKTCFQSMSECCSRWYRTQSSPDHS